MVYEPDPDGLIGVCSECKTDQRDSYIDNSPFDFPPCQMCGGVVIITPQATRDRSLAQQDQKRGL